MIVDYLKNLPKYQSVLPSYKELEKLLVELKQLSPGRYEINETNFINVVEGETQPIEEGQFEFHRNYLDIQIILNGEEYIKWQNIDYLQPAVDYDESNDIGFLDGEGEILHIKEDMFYIVYPEDAHMPGRHINNVCSFKKAVVKLKVN